MEKAYLAWAERQRSTLRQAMALGFSAKRLNLPYLQGDQQRIIRLINLIITKAKVKAKAKAKIKAKAKAITKAKAKAKTKAKGLKGLKRGKKKNQIRIQTEGHLTALITRNRSTKPLIHQKIRPIASL